MAAVVCPHVERDRLDAVLEQEKAEGRAGSTCQSSATKLRQRGDVAERGHTPRRRVDMHAGDADKAPLVPDPDVPACCEHPRREPRLRVRESVELVDFQEVVLAEQIDGSCAGGEGVCRASASLR